MAKGIAALVLAFVVGAAIAAFLRRGGLDDAPPGPVFGTATATEAGGSTVAAPTDTSTPEAEILDVPTLNVAQVVGLRGCDQPIFLVASGLPPRTRVGVQRIDAPAAMVVETSETGFAALDGRPLFERGGEPGARYPLRLVEEASGRELASSQFEVPVFPGTIEVDPASGGCNEIVVTVRGMPPDTAVEVFRAAQVDPFAHNFASIVWPPLLTDSAGVARSAPMRAPWSCGEDAVLLFATAGRDTAQTRQAELLYRIAVGPDEAVPSVERWLASMGR